MVELFDCVGVLIELCCVWLIGVDCLEVFVKGCIFVDE